LILIQRTIKIKEGDEKGGDETTEALKNVDCSQQKKSAQTEEKRKNKKRNQKATT
jgi:hypothetical protein